MVNLGNLLADRWDPPDLPAARDWYQQAADAGDTGAMNNLGGLLADRWDPPDLPAARDWYQQAADAGDTGAMNNLGGLLAYRWDPPDLPAARDWYQQAAAAGHTGAMSYLGVLAAERGDAVGATSAWQRVIDSDHADDEYVVNAALCMAAISALTGQICLAGELLRLAGQRGSSEASAYAATLDQGSPDRLEALRNLGRRTDDTDALNFLGIAAKVDGDLEKARASWDASVSGGDAVAPLLIKIAFSTSED
jgi:TPR repeat protein